MTTQFHTIEGVSHTLHCSKAAIRRWCREGMPYKRFGRLVRFELPAVLAWFEQRDTHRRGEKDTTEGANAN
jgi:excisionase family DNA binding protein